MAGGRGGWKGEGGNFNKVISNHLDKSRTWAIFSAIFMKIIRLGPLVFHNFHENQWAGANDFLESQ